ncbi:MAG TPA: YihY/virulence factor BrkB family protein, partial [Blastocatellia bacterium]|nr:YihY/virulence factor BrkB family protein [Blastocatellia bacterium]
MTAGKHKSTVMTRSFASYFVAYMDNDLTTSAAAISYFTMLVLFPTLLLLLTVGNQIMGPEAVEKYVIGQILAYLPGAQGFVRKNLESIAAISTELMISCLVIMLWAASWLFTVIENALNRIYGTYPRSFLHGRLVNLALMTLVFVLLGASALITAVVSAVRASASNIPVDLGPTATAVSGYVWQTIFILASLVITILLFTALYKVLPNTSVPLVEALPGAVLAGVLWEGAKFGFTALLPYFHYDLVYGSIGAAVAILSWVYLSSV